MRKLDLVGRRFDKLVCVADVGMDRHGSRLWLCICDCGNHVTKRVCVLTSSRQRQMACRECGEKAIAANRLTHGESRNRLCRAWINMRRRCRNADDPKNKYWAGRNVSVCEAWAEYEGFRDWAMANGYQPGLSLDRINPDGNYEPNNCRWVTVSQNTVYSLERRWKRG